MRREALSAGSSADGRPQGAVVVGLGNPDRADDGVGPAVVRAIGSCPGTEVWEAIRGGLPLAQSLLGFRRALIVDAAPSLPVGEVALFPLSPGASAASGTSPDATRDRSIASQLVGDGSAVWPHGMGLVQALATLRIAGLAIPEVWALAIGVAPELPFRRGLSPEVARAVPVAVAEVQRWLAN